MPAGRPTTYREEYIEKVDEYLKLCVDEWEQWTKSTSESQYGGSESFERIMKVNLPSREGFSEYIDVPHSTMKGWYKIPDFSSALEKIDRAQKIRLINGGLTGTYNSTIAKLILSSNHGMRERSETEHTGTLEVTQVIRTPEKKPLDKPE